MVGKTKIVTHSEQILALAGSECLFSYIKDHAREFPPDLCVELAEALCLGVNLPRNFTLARELLEHALEKDPVVGNYGLGRYFAVVDPECCYNYFNNASKHGHIPSKIIVYSMAQKCGGLQGYFARIKLRYSSFGAALKLSLGESSLQYWRYYDVAAKSELNQKLLPRDREDYFPWSRPMPLGEYLEHCRSDSAQVLR